MDEVTINRGQLRLFRAYAPVLASVTTADSLLRELLVEIELGEDQAGFKFECQTAAGLFALQVNVTRLSAELGIAEQPWQQQFDVAAQELARLRAGFRPAPATDEEG